MELVTVLRPVYGEDEFGGSAIQSWEEKPGYEVARLTRSAGLSEAGDAETVVFDVIFRTRKLPSLRELGPGWKIRDWHGQTYDVQRIKDVGSLAAPVSEYGPMDIGTTRSRGIAEPSS